MSETKLIQLSLVRIDGQTQYRDLVDQNTVREYAECMRDETEFPPVRCTFDGMHYWLWDGFHRYFATQVAGFRDIRVEFTYGTQEDAQDFALGANGRHGLPRNSATKRKQVEAALSMERHANKSDREIARLCDVSHKLVGAMRNPDVKAQQARNRLASTAMRLGSDPTGFKAGTDNTADPIPRLNEDYGPDEAELRASELAQQEDMEAMYKLLESDDALATAHEEIKRLNFLNSQLEVRMNGLMAEKNEAIKMVKALQRQVDKLQSQCNPVKGQSK